MKHEIIQSSQKASESKTQNWGFSGSPQSGHVCTATSATGELQLHISPSSLHTSFLHPNYLILVQHGGATPSPTGLGQGRPYVGTASVDTSKLHMSTVGKGRLSPILYRGLLALPLLPLILLGYLRTSFHKMVLRKGYAR